MNQMDIIGLAAVYTLIVAVLAVSIYLQKKDFKVNTRKVLHIGIGHFVFIWWMFTEQWVMLVFFTIPAAIALFIMMVRDNSALSRSTLGEINRRGNKTGLFFYAISISIIVIFFFNDHWVAGSIGIVAMTYGDAFGSLVGLKFGKHKTIHGKSWEGSFGVFAATAIMSIVVISFYGFLISNGWYVGNCEGIIPIWAMGLVAGLLTALIEVFATGEYDNLLIPTCVALAMAALGL